MERLQLDETTTEAAKKAADVVRRGGVVLYPTDTLYGLGADALSDEAVAKIFSIKGRDDGKPVHAIVADTAMAEQYGVVTEQVRTLVARLPKGKVTFIVKKRNFDTGIGKGIDTFGFRIPNNDFCVALLREFGAPITATSANRSGKRPERSVEKILAQLEQSNIPKYVSMLELAVDAGELPPAQPSTAIDLTRPSMPDSLRIVRAGAVSADEIRAAIRS